MPNGRHSNYEEYMAIKPLPQLKEDRTTDTTEKRK